jgi:hypothetical protein
MNMNEMSEKKQLPFVIAGHLTPLARSWLEEFTVQWKDQGLSIQTCNNLYIITVPSHWAFEAYVGSTWLIHANDEYRRAFRWVISPDDIRHSRLDAFLENDFLVVECQPHQHDQIICLQEHLPSLYLAQEDSSGKRLYECSFRHLPVPYAQMAKWLEEMAFQCAYWYSEESVCPKKHAGPARKTMAYTQIRIQHYLEFYQVTAESAAHATSLITQGLVQPYYSESVEGDGTIL